MSLWNLSFFNFYLAFLFSFIILLKESTKYQVNCHFLLTWIIYCLSFWNEHILSCLLLADWWSTYGGGCPNLSRLAIRILGQTCSLDVSTSHHKASSFDQIHDAKNSLEHQRVSDLVFVQHNFSLRWVSVFYLCDGCGWYTL